MTINFRVYGYVYGHIRASTKIQDAIKAINTIIHFANNSNLPITAFFTENESSAKLEHPELFRLLDMAQTGDIILIEQINRISRLNDIDWNKLKTIIKTKQLKIIFLDLPTSHQIIEYNDKFTDTMLMVINDLMFDMLDATVRKDYQDHRDRQIEGIAKAKTNGLYKGRRENTKLHRKIELLLLRNEPYSVIMSSLKCSRGTIAKVAKRKKELAK